MLTRTISVIALLALMAFSSQAQTTVALEQRVADDVQHALQTPPQGSASLASPNSAGVYLLGVKVDPTKHEIVLNLSQQVLNYGQGQDLEAVLRHITSSLDNVTSGWKETNFKILIDGKPLSEALAPADKELKAAVTFDKNLSVGNGMAASVASLASSGSLSGKRIVISPGHGWYWNEKLASWQLQRVYFSGIVEDFVNAEMVMYLNSELATTGADIRPTRNMDKNAGNGETLHPKWQEGAKYHIKALGAPSSVYSSLSVTSDYDKDIASRPLYANYVGANIMVSLHNNGGGATGTETWYDSSNGQETESRRLATAIHNKVIAAIRQQYKGNWTDRNVKSCNGCYGENRLATRPAALIEVAFMDTQSPDNDALHNEQFKQLVARAIRQGIEEYYGVSAPAGSFSLSSTAAAVSVTQGGKATFGVGVASSGGFSQRVDLSAKNLPGNRVISGTGWQPASVTPPANGTAYANFVLATDTATPVGTYVLTFEGTSGGVTKQTTVQLIVNPAPGNIVVNAKLNGVYWPAAGSGAVSYGIVGPSNSLSGFGVPTTFNNLPPGRYQLYFYGGGPGTFAGVTSSSVQTLPSASTIVFTLNFTAPPPDFAVTVSPNAPSVTRGNSVSTTISVRSLNGFAGPVNVSALNLPPGYVASSTSLSPNPVSLSANSSVNTTLRVGTSSATRLGTFTITINATGGGLTRQTTMTITVR